MGGGPPSARARTWSISTHTSSARATVNLRVMLRPVCHPRMSLCRSTQRVHRVGLHLRRNSILRLMWIVDGGAHLLLEVGVWSPCPPAGEQAGRGA